MANGNWNGNEILGNGNPRFLILKLSTLKLFLVHRKHTVEIMEVNITTCKFGDVTVFRDRAEVQRFVSFAPNLSRRSSENNEFAVRITGLTLSANMDSIRVKCASKLGKATVKCNIIEVSHETAESPIAQSGATLNEGSVQELTLAIENLEKACTTINSNIVLLAKQISLTEKYVESMLENRMPNGNNSIAWSGCPLTEASKLLDFHREKIELLNKESETLKDNLLVTNRDITLKKQILRKLTNDLNLNSIVKTQIVTVLYTIEEEYLNKLTTPVDTSDVIVSTSSSNIINTNNINNEQEVCLLLSYVVDNATWLPSYDVRVSTIDETMTLHYYAEVTQKSGEDWNDCRLYLSTSNPAIGSTPPPMQPKYVQWKTLTYPSYRGGGGGKRNSIAKLSNSVNANSRRLEDDDSDERLSVDMMYDERGGAPVGGLQAFGAGAGSKAKESHTSIKGSGDAGSTAFTIPRNVTIAGDSKSHKVTIAVEIFTPQLVHFVVPATSAFVYLQANTVNTSGYPLLACESNKASIFLDGNFVSTSSLQTTVSSGETFSMYLGVDPAIKVEYLPCRKVSRVKGWVSGTETMTYYYTTLITNSKQLPCKVIVVEQVPRSLDTEKITVELIEPHASVLTKMDPNKSSSLSMNDIFSNLEIMNETSSSTTTATNAPNGTDESATTAAMNAVSKPLPKDFISYNKYNGNVLWLKSISPKMKIELRCTYRVSWPQGNIGIEIV